MTASLLQLAIALLGALSTGGIIGAWLVHRREAPKVTAETTDMDWGRFQKEIARMEKKIAEQGERIDMLERKVSDLQCEKTELEIENMRLKAAEEIRGEVRTRAAEVVAADRARGEL